MELRTLKLNLCNLHNGWMLFFRGFGVMITLDAVGVVRGFVFTVRTGDQVGRPDASLTPRQIGKQNVFRFAGLAGVKQVPLSGGKSAHDF